jgi:hypothetical protein
MVAAVLNDMVRADDITLNFAFLSLHPAKRIALDQNVTNKPRVTKRHQSKRGALFSC